MKFRHYTELKIVDDILKNIIIKIYFFRNEDRFQNKRFIISPRNK